MRERLWLLTAVLTVLAVVSSGCGGTNEVTVTETIAIDDSVTETPEVVEDGEPEEVEGGRNPPDVSGGIRISVKQAVKGPTMTYMGGVQSQETPDGEETTVRAKQGGSYLFVKTSVENGSKEPIDLTCGYPFEINLVDAQDRSFTPEDGMSQIAGNPGCNNMLQPGFSANMTYVFMIPRDADPQALVFHSIDYEDLGSDENNEAVVPVEVG